MYIPSGSGICILKSSSFLEVAKNEPIYEKIMMKHDVDCKDSYLYETSNMSNQILIGREKILPIKIIPLIKKKKIVAFFVKFSEPGSVKISSHTLFGILCPVTLLGTSKIVCLKVK